MLASLLLAAIAYVSPVHYPIELAGNFGEPRPNHFHAGIDVKTDRMTGKPLYAMADGFISCVAALCAVRLCPAAAKAVFASHCSTEPAAKLVLDALNKKALITAGLHLGEGTGAVAAIPLWDMALAVYDGCYSFEEGGIEAYTPQGGEGC